MRIHDSKPNAHHVDSRKGKKERDLIFFNTAIIPLLPAAFRGILARFIVPKEQERAEVLVQRGVGGFQFKKGETYVFRYSFRARENMKVSGSSTRLGQMKGVSSGFQLKGNPLFSLTANNNGINVRFNNEDSDNVVGMDEYLSWEDSVGEWVDVEIKTTFGKSMEVCARNVCTPVVTLRALYHTDTCSQPVCRCVQRITAGVFTEAMGDLLSNYNMKVIIGRSVKYLQNSKLHRLTRAHSGSHLKVTFSGAVEGKAAWPSSYKPVAWNNDADSVMFKLGLYHIKNKVGTR